MPDAVETRERALAQIDELMAVLRQRKETYRRRRPAVVNLIAAAEMERFLRNGLVGRHDLPEKLRRERRALARAEAEHFTALMENEPIGVQIGIVLDTLPHTSFQIFRQPDRQILALSPFRLGEEPNIRVGMAMITSAPEALALHEKMARELWASALKGPAAVRFMRTMIENHPPLLSGGGKVYARAYLPRLKKRSFWSSLAVSRFDLMAPTLASAAFTAGRSSIDLNQRARFGLSSHFTPWMS